MSEIGKMTNARSIWKVSPVTRIKNSKKKYDRNKHKKNTKGRIDERV